MSKVCLHKFSTITSLTSTLLIFKIFLMSEILTEKMVQNHQRFERGSLVCDLNEKPSSENIKPDQVCEMFRCVTLESPEPRD